jgi:hypothetical protein
MKFCGNDREEILSCPSARAKPAGFWD